MKGRNISLWFGATVLGVVGVAALTAPWWPIPSPTTQNLSLQFAAPSPGHPLGTGENGVDILSQIVWGARVSLGVGLGSVILSGFVGLLLGSLAGMKRGTLDLVLMRFADMIAAFPGILLVVALAAVLGPSLKNMIFALVLSSWTSYARLVRSQCLSLRERDFIQAARALGVPPWKILVRHVWPNVLPLLWVQMSLGLGGAILAESSLSFLGLGVPAGMPSWGQMLNSAREVVTDSTRLIMAPTAALVLTILAVNLFGDGLRDKLDPKKGAFS